LAKAPKKHTPVTAKQRSSPAARAQEQIRYAAAGLACSSARCATAAVSAEVSPSKSQLRGQKSGARLGKPGALQKRGIRFENIRHAAVTLVHDFDETL
jgi:hypothetical protein